MASNWWKGGEVATVSFDKNIIMLLVESKIKGILSAAAIKVAGDTKANILSLHTTGEMKIRSGKLLDSVTPVLPGQSLYGLTAGPTSAYVVIPVKYAIPQEEGFTHYATHKWIPGKHFLRQALEGLHWSTQRSPFGND